MKSKSWLRWLPPAVILAAGILFSLLARFGTLPNPLFRTTFWFDLSALFFFAALLISFVWVVVLLLSAAQQRRIIHARGEERTAQAEERQRFLRRLDHELKNPLTTIRLGIANLKEDACPGEEMSGSLDRISHQVQRLQTLVENLRRLGEMDETSLDRAAVNLAEVIEEAAGMALAVPEYRDRTLSTSIQQVPWPLPPIMADRDLLVLAFRNLIENALKFSQPESRVEVRASEDGRGILVEVNDSGLGISAEDLAHIFDELFRGENARGLPGSGLGLTLVRRIIELHGGSIEVASRPNQGTMVRVRLPSTPA